MLVGIITNIISIYVFLKKRLRKRKFNLYLLVLTVFELIFCSLLFVDYFFAKLNKDTKFLHDYKEFAGLFFDFTIHTIDSCIVILTLVLSVDRLYAIENPMKIKFFVTYLHAKYVTFVSITFLFVLKLSSFIFCEKMTPHSVVTVWYCALVSPLIFNIIPLFIICALNSTLVIKIIKYYQGNDRDVMMAGVSLSILRLNNQPSRNLSSASRLSKSSFQSQACRPSTSPLCIQSVHKKKKISKSQKSHYLVILASGMWIILSSIVYYTINSYVSLASLDMFSNLLSKKTTRTIQIISSILFNFNHSINFFIYIGFDEEFKSVIRNIFCTKKAILKNENRTKINFF